MDSSSKFESDLSNILKNIMLADMGTYKEGAVAISTINKDTVDDALKALNDVKSYKPRDDVRRNLREAGRKLVETPPADNETNGDEWRKWALKANLASSCLSIVFPQLAIGLCEWICPEQDKLRQEQDETNRILKIWATYNLALAYKDTKGGVDRTETKLKEIVDSEIFSHGTNEIIKMAEATFRWPAFIQLFEIHKDRQEKTRFDKLRQQFFMKVLETNCTCGKDCVPKECSLLREMEKQKNDNSNRAIEPQRHYKKYISASLFLLCQEYKILSMRADCRKLPDDNTRIGTISARGECFAEVRKHIKDRKGWNDLESKLFLLALEYIHESLRGIGELESQDELNRNSRTSGSSEEDASWKCLTKIWKQIAKFVHGIEDNKGKAERLFPERFEWWIRALEQIIELERKKKIDEKNRKSRNKKRRDFLERLVNTLNNNDKNNMQSWIKGVLESLLIDKEPSLEIIRETINREQMRGPEHRDPEIEEHLRQYRKVVGLFNDNFHNDLIESEVQLIKNSVCTKKLKDTDKWLVAQLCSRRRFLEDNSCFSKKQQCLWGSNGIDRCMLNKKMDLHRMVDPVKGVFDLKDIDDKDGDKPQVFGSYLDRVFQNRRTEFKSRLCHHSCHNEMAKGRFGLTCLRRWQSFTPALSAPQKVSRGGGYFVFKSKGDGSVEKGVVIDPGLYFLENFFEEGFSIQDIDAVLLTHHHLDHRDDLESILTLIHEAAKKGAPNNIKLVVTKGAWPDIDSMIRRAREDIEDIFTIENSSEPGAIRNIVESIVIDWNDAYHDCFESDCVGYRLCLKSHKNKSFLFTGDTIYTPLSLGRNTGGPLDRVIMLNLGGVVSDKANSWGNAWKLEELRKAVQDDDQDKISSWILSTGFLENHLYLTGALQLLCDWRGTSISRDETGLAVLCELPEELLGGHRKTIARAIQVAINKDKEKRFVVLPEDVGLRISYAINEDDGPKIECLYCSQLVEPAEIEAIPWGLEERLMFVCRNCRKAADPYLLEEKFKEYRDRGRPFEKAES